LPQGTPGVHYFAPVAHTLHMRRALLQFDCLSVFTSFEKIFKNHIVAHVASTSLGYSICLWTLLSHNSVHVVPLKALSRTMLFFAQVVSKTGKLPSKKVFQNRKSLILAEISSLNRK
jgi:hypothetical protein